MAVHERDVRALEAEALRLAGAGEPLAAAAWAQAAAHHAAHNACGLLAAPRLERLLHAIGRVHVPGTPQPERKPGPERVLHVFTETYPVGGHTRAALRWMERDTERVPTALLLAQVAPLPDAVPETVERCGGQVLALPPGDLIARARGLRKVAAEHDLVVLHVGAQDVLPTLAFADPVGRPPTVLFDHASHTLWLGTGCSDVVAAVSEPDAANVRTRRGVPGERVAILPLPVDPSPLPARDEARHALGVDPGTPLVLTIVSDWRIRPVLEPSFTDLAAAVLDAAPDAHLLAVGPEPGPAWHALAQRTGGRVRALGPQADLGPYLAAADLYLDSWPACGGTTLLDVAAAKLPAISLGDPSPELALARPRGTVLDGGVILAETPEELASTASALLGDPECRAELGTRLHDVVQAEHGGDGWSAHLERLVAQAKALHGTAQPPTGDPSPAAPAWEAITHLLQDGADHTAAASFVANAHLLPAHLRPASAPAALAEAEQVLARSANADRRGIAAPAVERDTVRAAVGALRRLHADGTVASCAVVIPTNELDAALPLLEEALQRDGDLDLDVLVADSVDDLARPSDLVVAV
jgi:hypothetical protein